jgi:polysaccharide biosynthesis/export protein
MKLVRLLLAFIALCMLIAMSAVGLWAQENMAAVWMIVDEGDKEGPSVWTYDRGQVIQTGNIYGGFDADIAKPGTFAVAGDTSWSDYTISLDLRSRDNDGIGVIFRFRDGDNYYRFSMDRQRSYRRLVKKVAGQVVVLAEDAFVYVQDKWYRFKAEVKQDHFKIYLDGQLVFDVRDDALSQGKLGLYCWGNAGSEFAGITVNSRGSTVFPVAGQQMMAVGAGTKKAPATATTPVAPTGTFGGNKAGVDDTYRPLIAMVLPTDGPVYETSKAMLDISGIAHDDSAIAQVVWQSTTGASGVAEGTERWTINGVPLNVGENRLTFTAIDTAGNREEKQLMVTRVASEDGSPSAPAPTATIQQPATVTASPMMPTGNYIIGAGDVLDISVWKDAALSKVATVLPDGSISLPLAGQIQAKGKTIAMLQKELVAKIAPYVPNPIITVTVSQANSMIIYVLGKVNSPGRFPLVGNVNVLQALAMAGGLNTFAKSNRIKIFRQIGSETQIFEFKYDQAARGESLEQNIELVKGDVIVVP